MSESTFESRIEDTVKSSLSEGAGIVGAVAGGMLRRARTDEETGKEGFVDIVLYTAKVKAADTLRRWLSPR